MNFPSTIAIVKQFNFFLLTGPGAICAGLLLLGRAMVKWGKRHDAAADMRRAGWPQFLVFAVAMIIVGAMHLQVYRSVAVAREFQTIRLDDVDGLIIEEIADSDGKTVQTVLVANADVARRGLRKLARATSYARNHETFAMGYRIQLIIKGKKTNKYLSIYQNSSRAGAVPIVIPHFGRDPAGVEFQGGTYQCAAFLEWVREAIQMRESSAKVRDDSPAIA